MTTLNRQIAIELIGPDGAVKEYAKLPAGKAAERLREEMSNRYRWRIAPPDRTGELIGDERRYAEDCAACGVGNPFDA